MSTSDKYHKIIVDAIAGINSSEPSERNKIYQLARKTLREKFDDTEAAVDTQYLVGEISALDAAIQEVEENFSAQRESNSAHIGVGLPINNGASYGTTTFDEHSHEYNVDHPASSSMTSQISRGKQFATNVGAATFVNIVRVFIQLASIPILARLLTPSDYGVYALAFPTVSLFMMLADGGLGVSLARESETNRILWSTAFWTLLATCSVMSVLTCASGFVLAWISGDRTLIALMMFLSASLPLLAFTVVADARLIRRGNLLYHGFADLCGLITGAAVGLFIAVHNGGAWSLAAQYVSTILIRTIILNSAARARPYFEYDFACLSNHVSIGGWLLLTRISDTVGRIVENSLFGRFFGPSLLGSYTLGFQLVRFSCESVTNPILGAFYAHAVSQQNSDIGRLHLFLSRVILVILMPFVVFLSILAPKILPFILGDQWHHAATFVRILIVPYAIAAASWLSGQVLLKNGIVARSTLISICINTFRIVSVISGIWFDSVVIAWLFAVSFVIQSLALTMAVPEGLGAEKVELFKTFIYIFISSTIAGCFVYGFDYFGGSGWLIFTADTFLGGIVYAFCIFLLMKKTFHSDYLAIKKLAFPI